MALRPHTCPQDKGRLAHPSVRDLGCGRVLPVMVKGARAFGILGALGLLVACGPVPLRTAEAICFDRARLAAAPRGEVKIGVSNGKPAGGVSVGVTSDYLLGRDPSAVYDQCVLQKSGQMPSLPLYSRPDWTG
jgi:hypothetical protein